MINPKLLYIDAAVTTYAIQAIVGIVVTVGAVIGIFWRRARKKVSDKLGIDEEKRKEVEDELLVYTKTDEDETE